jgi:GxxExxY protein
LNSREEIELLATKLIDIAFQIHVELGPGLFESVYEEVFCIELERRNIPFKRQQTIDIHYKEHRIERAFQCDIMVDGTIIIELKSIEKLNPVHFKQLGTYLKLTGLKLGLLINFNEALIKDGIKRVANGL